MGSGDDDRDAGGGRDGSTAGQDAGDGGATQVPSVFTEPYVQGQPGPGAPANDASPEHGGTVAGKDCLSSGCHNGSFLFGGTVFDATGTRGVSGAEVRVAFPDGRTFSTYTDADGNFWTSRNSVLFPAGARVGVRSATKAREHVSPISTGACSGSTCHGSVPDRVKID